MDGVYPPRPAEGGPFVYVGELEPTDWETDDVWLSNGTDPVVGGGEPGPPGPAGPGRP